MPLWFSSLASWRGNQQTGCCRFISPVKGRAGARWPRIWALNPVHRNFTRSSAATSSLEKRRVMTMATDEAGGRENTGKIRPLHISNKLRIAGVIETAG